MFSLPCNFTNFPYLQDEVDKLITSTLREREQEIIRLYYGLGNECLTWEDISRRSDCKLTIFLTYCHNWLRYILLCFDVLNLSHVVPKYLQENIRWIAVVPVKVAPIFFLTLWSLTVEEMLIDALHALPDIFCCLWGSRIGLSRERVRQVGLVALEKLKHAARKRRLDAMLVHHWTPHHRRGHVMHIYYYTGRVFKSYFL